MFEDTYEVIEKRMQDNWVTTPVDYDNDSYQAVEDTEYVRLQIEWATSVGISIGGLDRGTGLIYLSIFVPIKGGTRAATVLADSLKTLFKRYTSTPVRCGVPYLQRVGEDGPWYQLNVLVPFASDECDN